jgi:4-hydroxy-2-oxoheptanedioate aldolase
LRISPPVGERSYGPYRHRLLFKDGFSPEKANSKITTLAMIETKRGLQNLEDILSVPNLSGIFIGPNDLGLSLGFQPTSSPQGKVLESVLHVCNRARANNKIAGIFCSDVETAKSMAKAGFNFVVYGSDLGLVVSASNRSLTEARL